MNVENIRSDFDVLQKPLDGKPIVYLDSACQSLRPKQVVEKMLEYYNEFPACGGRSMHKFGRRVTEEIVAARQTAQKFFRAKHMEEIIFTRNTTEGINLVAHAFPLAKGDEILLSDKEHNSNLVPWQVLAAEKGIVLKRFRFGDIRDFEQKLSKKTKLAAFAHTSNVDGTSNPAEEMIRVAHDNKSIVLIDGAQSAPHREIDLKKLDADFFACSGHKMLGPSGTGMLYGKTALLEGLHPFMTGGETVLDTTYEAPVFEKHPRRFEAGLKDYAGIMGLAEALRYLERVGLENIERHEIMLNKKVTGALQTAIEVVGPPDAALRSSIFSFTIKGMDPHHIAVMLDSSSNIMIRSGMHCCHSWFNANRIQGCARASFALYTTEEECELFAEEVVKLGKFFAH